MHNIYCHFLRRESKSSWSHPLLHPRAIQFRRRQMMCKGIDCLFTSFPVLCSSGWLCLVQKNEMVANMKSGHCNKSLRWKGLELWQKRTVLLFARRRCDSGWLLLLQRALRRVCGKQHRLITMKISREEGGLLEMDIFVCIISNC